MRVVLAGALVVLALVAGARWASDRSDETSEAVSRSLTTPIERAARVEAEANVRGALPAVQAYFSEHGTYTGISTQALRSFDSGLSPTVQVFPAGAGYCVTATVRGVSVRNLGPSSEIADGTCP